MSSTSAVVYENAAPERVFAPQACPAEVTEAFARFEKAQAQGATTEGSEYDLTRRYELDGGALTYLPELGLPTTALFALVVTLCIGSLCAFIIGFALLSDGYQPARYIVLAGVVLLIAGVKASGRHGRIADARREGIETLGLYLLPGFVVLRTTEGCRVYARNIVTRFLRVKLGGQDTNMSYLVVEYVGSANERFHSRVVKGAYPVLLGFLNERFTELASSDDSGDTDTRGGLNLQT